MKRRFPLGDGAFSFARGAVSSYNPRMKILIGGQFWKGSTEIMVTKAFTSLGHEVHTLDFARYQPSFVNRAANKFFKTPHYWKVGGLNKNLIAEAQNCAPDFILLFKPIFIVPQTVEALKKIAKTFSWYPDYVKFPKTSSNLFYRSIPNYDVHFSFNYANSLELKNYGAKASVFLPCAADPDVYHPPAHLTPEEQSLGADVLFMGTYAPEPRVEYMERLCKEGFKIKVYGNGWEKMPKDSCLVKSGAVQFKPLYLEDMAKAMYASKIVTAFVRKHNDETLACRTYEIPACGAFMLHERTAKTGEVFEEGKEAEFFGSYEEFRDKVKHYLAHPEERSRIAAAGHVRVQSGGLFTDRARFIIEFYRKMRNT
jgi:spore maturation protein CgeB